MPIEMSPEMLSMPRGIGLDEPFAALRSQITNDRELLFIKCAFKRRQLLFGYFQVLGKTTHFSAFIDFVIVSKSPGLGYFFVIVTNS